MCLPSTTEGEWVSWRIDERAGAKLQLGPVFLGELGYPYDFGLGSLWRAWLNQQHLGYFRSESEAKQRVENEIVRRLRLMAPALSRFRQRVPSVGFRPLSAALNGDTLQLSASFILLFSSA